MSYYIIKIDSQHKKVVVTDSKGKPFVGTFAEATACHDACVNATPGGRFQLIQRWDFEALQRPWTPFHLPVD